VEVLIEVGFGIAAKVDAEEIVEILVGLTVDTAF
jgi:hypothetical protein